MKRCFKCSQEKPESEFYAHPAMKDRLLGKCKACTKNDVRIREVELRKNPEWVKSEQNRHREKYHRLGYRIKHKPSPEKAKLTAENRKKRYPEKEAARGRAEYKSGFHAHHWSYKEQHKKDVIFMKPDEHYTLHRFLTYLPEQMIYQTRKGEILDTREKHEAFIARLFDNF